MSENEDDLVPGSWLDDGGGGPDDDPNSTASETLSALAAAARSKADPDDSNAPDVASPEAPAGEPTTDLAKLQKKRAAETADQPESETAQSARQAAAKKSQPGSGKSAAAKKKSQSQGQAAAKKSQPQGQVAAANKVSEQRSAARGETVTPKEVRGRVDAKTVRTARPVAGRSSRPVGAMLAGVFVLVAVVGLAAWLLIGRGGTSEAEVTEPDSVDGVTLSIDSCGAEGAAAILKNDGAEAMEFDAGIDFVDGDGVTLYPVRIAVDLEAGATRRVRAPFRGEAPASGLRCVGTLRNVLPKS